MRIRKLIAALVCAAATVAPALAQENPEHARLAAELTALREQIAQMQSMYESRIAALEEKLAGAARPEATDAAASPTQTDPQPQAPSQARLKSTASSFNPEVSLILQGAYVHRKEVEDRHIGGFVAADDHRHHGHSDRRGFTLDHTELVFAANIDPYWRGQAIVAVLDDEVELEEAWFQTTALGHGTGIRAGRFRSGIGYLNELHAHQWDFYEQPLMYKALFGRHSYVQDGAQLKWVAPLPFFAGLGAEIGRGQNFPGNDRNISGANSHALFAHVGSDIGVSHSWRAGLSWLRTRASERESHFEMNHGHHHHHDEPGAFSGRSRVWIADFVYKWAPDGNPARRNFKFQAEYFRRAEDGTLTADIHGNTYDSVWRTRQSGYYLASVYRFTPNWRAGMRYDRLSSGRQNLGDNPLGIETVNYRPNRVSAMVDYNWSEFSRLRLQYSRDRAMPGLTDNQVMLQYIMSLGSHGAHRF